MSEPWNPQPPDLPPVVVPQRPPERPASGVIAEGFGVPFLQSASIAVAIALAVAFGIWALLDMNGNTPDWRILVMVSAAFFLALFGILMAVFTGHWRDARWWVERAFQVDLDGDRHKGKPPREFRTIQVQVVSADGKHTDIVEIESVSADQMCQIAAGLVSGVALTHAEWVRKRGIVSDPSFRALQEELVQKALAVWRNPQAHNQGMDPTSLGWTVLQAYAAQK